MNTPTDGERDLAALCVRLVRRLREVSPGDKLATSATDYLNRKRYLNPLRIKALEKADALGVPVADRLHPECAWCTFCGKTDHTESQCPTVADGVAGPCKCHHEFHDCTHAPNCRVKLKLEKAASGGGNG